MIGFKPIEGVSFVCGDIGDQKIMESALQKFDLQNSFTSTFIHVILSDMSPRISGIKVRDQAESAKLLENTLAIVRDTLKPDGCFVYKYFSGSEMASFRSRLNGMFRKVSIYKPESSRKCSAEIYFVCKGYKQASPEKDV